MSKEANVLAYIVITIFLFIFIGYTLGTVNSQSSQEPYQIEHFTEVERAKLENGEPVQVMGWYRTGEEWHSVYARKLPFKRYLNDNQVLVYEVVLTGEEYYQKERFD